MPTVAQAGNKYYTEDVVFVADAVNNKNVLRIGCRDENVICLKGKTYHFPPPKITDNYGSDTWVRVKTDKGIARIKMGNLFVSWGDYCLMSFESLLAGEVCFHRRPQGPPATPAPSIDP